MAAEYLEYCNATREPGKMAIENRSSLGILIR